MAIINTIIKSFNLPAYNYKIDAWEEGVSYNYIDTETNIVSLSKPEKLSCGCCFDYVQYEEPIDSLEWTVQCEIVKDLYDRYYDKE